MNESFWTLLRSAAHWEFEIFLMIVFDGLILGALYPFLRKHYEHHIARDKKDEWPEMRVVLPGWSMNDIARANGHVPCVDVVDYSELTKVYGIPYLSYAMLDRYPPFDDLVSDQKTPKTVDDDITKA